MSRIRLQMPENFSFHTDIDVRITDINYGGHLGNDSVLSLLHETRMKFLNSLGYTELEFESASLIMADAAIEFKNEAFYGDRLQAMLAAGNFTAAGFDIFYKLQNQDGKIIVLAKTGMVCFDYSRRKPAALSKKAIEKLQG